MINKPNLSVTASKEYRNKLDEFKLDKTYNVILDCLVDDLKVAELLIRILLIDDLIIENIKQEIKALMNGDIFGLFVLI